MKKNLLRLFLVISALLFISVFSLFGVLFFRPEVLINTSTLKIALDKSNLLKSWTWDKGNLDFSWNAWNDRSFRGEFKNFCYEYVSVNLDSSSCINEISWSFHLSWTLKNGFKVKSIDPFVLKSDLLKVITREQAAMEEERGPPQIWDYWTKLWAKWFPDLDINIREIQHMSDNSNQNIDLRILKGPKKLLIESMGLKLSANPEKIVLTGPEVYRLPEKIKLKNPLELRNTKLTAWMKKDGIPLKLSADLEGLLVNFDSYIGLPMRKSFSSLSFRRNLILSTRGVIKVNDIRKVVQTYVPEPYDELPAPLNVMNGEVEFHLDAEESDRRAFVLLKSSTRFNLEGKKQVIRFTLSGDVLLNLVNFSRGLMQIGIQFSEVSLQLPRLSKKEPPPQFFPDKRFKSKKEGSKTAAENKNKLSLDLEAMNDRALHIKSNLLDEPLRLNFDLDIRSGDIKQGFLKVLPLKTTVFKRPVRVRELVINFNAPLEPVIKSTIQFPLPEYKITLKLEGPLSNPRHAFSSKPPLPQNDIYAVLLFGRPLAELKSDDKNAARQTNKLLAQGVLSLSVLYFLAGSPVEYIGFDPDTGRATAQVGIDRKTSLNVGAGEGSKSTGVRRSLGKGWYLDTSVQSTSDPTKEGARDYGVLLERIIAY